MTDIHAFELFEGVNLAELIEDVNKFLLEEIYCPTPMKDQVSRPPNAKLVDTKIFKIATGWKIILILYGF